VVWFTRSLAQVFQLPEIKKIRPTAIAMITPGTSHDLSRFDQLWPFGVLLTAWESPIVSCAPQKAGSLTTRLLFGSPPP
jgi:hypothetical protein